MKIGIYLGYGPKTVLSKEGLGRYVGNLVRNLQKRGNHIVIACPKWLKGTLKDLWEDLQIKEDSIEYIVTSKVPVAWRLYLQYTGKNHQKKLLHVDYTRVIEFIVNQLLSITSVAFFGLLLLLGGFFLLLLAPFLLLAGMMYLILYLLSRLKKSGSNKAKRMMKWMISIYGRAEQGGLDVYNRIYVKFIENVQKELVRKINRKKDIDIWYSPAIFWPTFNDVEGVKIVNVPDLVTETFATKWGNYRDVLYSTKQCEKTIEENTDFIVYSNFIKESLLVNKFGKQEERISVIPHPMNDLSVYVTINSEAAGKLARTELFTEQYCKTILQSLGSHTQGIDDYIVGYDFSDVTYIFYSSQGRPHKNLKNLIKAYEYLLRKKYVRVKLFLTCDVNALPEVRDYIIEKRLQYDVISFFNVTTKELAALYRKAQLVVNPTLYEGGFPFTFGEGMSVGTPSVMSRIPQVLEVVDGYNLEDVLFDPYNIYDIAEKIKYGLENRELLLSRESVLFRDLLKNNEEKNGAMYEEVFNKAIIRSRNRNY